MIDRIKKIMNKEGFNPATFADFLGINRQTMNATLSRNKTASINVVLVILEKYEEINSDWLLFGKGPMYRGEKAFLQPDLFANTPEIQPDPQLEQKQAPNFVVEKPEKATQTIEKKEITPYKIVDKKIDKIVIFYTDKTFVTLTPEE